MKIQALQVGPIGTNCYLLCDEAAKVCAVVDPGGEPELILSAVEKLGCSVDKILLTHGHYDHTGGVAALLGALPPAAVYIHEADFDSPIPQLFPLKNELSHTPFGGANFYGDGDRLTVGTLELQVPLAIPREASRCCAATPCSAGIPSLPVPAAGRTFTAAAWTK